MATMFLQVLMYAPGAFFIYPWKPLVNALSGDKYDIAYQHFRRDHTTIPNLSMHTVCMFFQLLGNFALLNAIDDHLRWPHMSVSAISAIVWALYLVAFAEKAPPVATLFSVVSIAGAYFAGPSILAAGIMLESYMISACVIVGVITIHNIKAVGLAVCWLGFFIFDFYQIAEKWRESMSSQSTFLSFACVILLCLLSAHPKVPIVPVVVGVPIIRATYFLTGEPLLLFWGNSMTGMLLQGFSHKLSKEEATLINLNKKKSITSKQKLQYEWAHVTFFPTLVYHALYETFTFSNVEENSMKKSV